jgi:gliding motility-associated-like protein
MLNNPMTFRKLLVVLLVPVLATFSLSLRAQTCTTLGQTPATAFPVCGSNTFVQDSVPVCNDGGVAVPDCGATGGYSAINPYWYKFTCFKSGTLGLLISPNNPGDDYDWQLWDVTGQDINTIYTNVNQVVGDNWSGVTGNTGASASGTASSECESLVNPGVPATSPPPFSSMPTLIQGHNYLLLISHFLGSGQSGYQLSFGGGTASITDTVQPAIASANAICTSVIGVKLNKDMTCASLTATGSEFSITPAVPGVQIAGAVGNNCGSGFDMDSITLTLSGSLPLGNYTLTAINGTDGNTLLDVCGAAVPVGEAVTFTVVPPQATLMGVLQPPGCAPNILKLVFNGPTPIQCSSIAPDGSDFLVTGSSAVPVTGASGVCDASGLTDTILVQLSAPIQTAGSYQLTLQAGDDGNTLLNFCGVSTPPASVAFTTLDTVSAAALSGKIEWGCKQDTIVYTYPSEDGVNQWLWTFNGTDTSQVQDPPMQIYPLSGNEAVSLKVSNGVCSDSTQTVYALDNGIQAKFEGPMMLCPKDAAQFVNYSSGVTISTWAWSFGDGTTSDQQTPPDHLFPQTGQESNYTVTLVVANSFGCTDTATQAIEVLKSCFIAVPGAFTPNGDGVNDYLYPLNALMAVDLQFRVYNRWGQMVFETTNWLNKWDGTVGGHPAPAGTYVWTLAYTDPDTGKRIFQKGTSLLIR